MKSKYYTKNLYRIVTVFSGDEHTQFIKAVKKAGVPKSRYIRQAVQEKIKRSC